MANTRTKQALTDDAKLAKLNVLAKNHQIKADNIEALKEKYGPYAYDILLATRAEPTNLMARIGQKPLSSSKALQYFLENDIDTATLAKAVKQDEMRVQATLANYNINQTEAAATTPTAVAEVQTKAATTTSEFDARVDTTAAQNNAQSLEQTQTDNTRPMTLDDYVANYPANRKPLTDAQIKAKAYNDFAKAEGLRQYVYQDVDGSPTIGNGHLIFQKEKINDAAYIKRYRAKFQELDLQLNGRKLSTEEKGRLYDRMVNDVKKDGKLDNPAQYGKLSPEASKKAFNQIFDFHYGQAKAAFPQISKYPSDLQLTLIHAYYGGYANIIDNALNGKNKRPYNVPEMKQFQDLDKNNPEAVQQLLDTLTDINSRRTARAFKNQIIAVEDTISQAQLNYQTKIKLETPIQIQQSDQEIKVATQSIDNNVLVRYTQQQRHG